MRHATDYLGLIGNGQTAALVGNDFSISWFCPGRFDAFPLFAGALDPTNGGSWGLTFSAGGEEGQTSQSYLGRTNLLQTTLTNQEYQVCVTDFMPWGHQALIREAQVVNQTDSELTLEVTSSIRPITTHRASINLNNEGDFLVYQITPPDLNDPVFAAFGRRREVASPEDDRTICAFAPIALTSLVIPPRGKQRLTLATAYSQSVDEAVKGLNQILSEPNTLLQEDLRFWFEWIAQARPLSSEHPRGIAEAYYRSLLVLKALTYEPTGAIIAAPTASFPATPGGWENWDYRYVWLRDGYYSALALDRAGFHREARRFYDFIATLQDVDGGWSQPLYTVTGTKPEEFIADDLQGPGGEKPIRFGNLAADQLQLDNAGNVLDGLWQHYVLTKDQQYLASWWPRVKKAANWVSAHWHEPESGIWEIRGHLENWVHGKVMCAAALWTAVRIGEALGDTELAAIWAQSAKIIADQVCRGGWSDYRQAYLRHYGNEAPLDVSVLALEFYGILPADDFRLQSTVALMEKDISRGGLAIGDGIARYDYAVVPFYLPTLWLARYYAHIGNKDRAMELIWVCLRNATPLLLMAEHFDPFTKAQWGNFPQAFSHEELIQTVLDLENISQQILRQQG